MRLFASRFRSYPQTGRESSAHRNRPTAPMGSSSASGSVASNPWRAVQQGHETQKPGRANPRPSPWLRYGAGVLIPLLALGLTYLLDSHLSQTPTPLLFAAVTVAAWYGGLGPGVVATFVSAMGLSIFLEDPNGIQEAGESSLLHLAVFVLVAFLVSSLNERRLQAEAQAWSDASRLEILSDSSRAFAAALPDHLTTLQAVARQVGETIGHACVISLLSEDGRRLNHAAWHHRDPEAHALMGEIYTDQYHGADEGVSGMALTKKRPQLITSDRPDDIRMLTKPEYAPLLDRFPIHSVISIPLRARGRSIGTLTLWRGAPKEPFTPTDQDLLQELADRSAMAIDNAQLSVYYQTLFQQIPEPAVVLDTEHRLVDANPAASRLLNRSLESLRSTRVDILLGGKPGDLESMYEGMRREGSWHGDLDLRCQGGETVPVEVRTAAVQLLSGPVYISVWRDLTKQRSLEEMRNRFAASASHELRTPLTAALAALGLMHEPGSGHLVSAQRELLTIAMRNIQRLRILVDDLLADVELQANVLGLNRTPLDLREVIVGSVEAMHSLLQRKEQSIELDVAGPLPVDGDARRLEQVFINLLANANQHTPKGSRITITGHFDGKEVCVVVSDDGPGIPADQIDTLFERFSRIDTASTGTGLGLAIVHDLVELHDGCIRVEAMPGRGTAFRITLPSSVDGDEQ